MSDRETILLKEVMAAIVEAAPASPELPTLDAEGPLPRVRPVVAFAAALAAVLLVIGVSTLLLSRGATEGEPAGPVPTTIQPEPATPTTVAEREAIAQTNDRVQGETTITWVEANLPTDDDYPRAGSVAFSNGRYVAAGDGVWYSDDLATWNRVSDEAVVPLDSVEIVLERPAGQVVGGPLGFLVTHSGGYYVFADGARGLAAVFVSEDGVTWTQSEIREPDEWDSLNVEAVIAGGPGWVAVGETGGDGRIWVSEDGLEWETIALPEFKGVTLNYVSEANGLLTVAGTAGNRFARDADARSWISEDGLTWQPEQVQDQPVHPATHSIAVNPITGQHVAMNVHGVWTSDDGIKWQLTATDNGTPPYTHPTEGAVWIGDTVLGVQRYQDWIYESRDGGLTWIRSHPFSHEENNGIGPHRLYIKEDFVIATIGGLWVGTPD